MTNFKANAITETYSTRVKMPDFPTDLPAVIRQIRVCRSALGAVLDELECDEENTNTVEKLAELATAVTAEIESLWEATKKAN